jgi:hypothetical protein
MDTCVATLSKLDRCDRCGAAAKAVVHTTPFLLMCQHHANTHEAALAAEGIRVTYPTQIQ